MAVSNVELRLSVLEAEVARLKKQIEPASGTESDWLAETFGAFADYPDYDKVIELGRKYRESLRPSAARKSGRKKAQKRRITGKKANVHSRHRSR